MAKYRIGDQRYFSHELGKMCEPGEVIELPDNDHPASRPSISFEPLDEAAHKAIELLKERMAKKAADISAKTKASALEGMSALLQQLQALAQGGSLHAQGFLSHQGQGAPVSANSWEYIPSQEEYVAAGHKAEQYEKFVEVRKAAIAKQKSDIIAKTQAELELQLAAEPPPAPKAEAKPSKKQDRPQDKSPL